MPKAIGGNCGECSYYERTNRGGPRGYGWCALTQSPVHWNYASIYRCELGSEIRKRKTYKLTREEMTDNYTIETQEQTTRESKVTIPIIALLQMLKDGGISISKKASVVFSLVDTRGGKHPIKPDWNIVISWETIESKTIYPIKEEAAHGS